MIPRGVNGWSLLEVKVLVPKNEVTSALWSFPSQNEGTFTTRWQAVEKESIKYYPNHAKKSSSHPYNSNLQDRLIFESSERFHLYTIPPSFRSLITHRSSPLDGSFYLTSPRLH